MRRKKNITGPPQVRRVSVCPEDKEIGGMYRAVEETEQFKEGGIWHEEYLAHKYKMLILPNRYLRAPGVAYLGGVHSFYMALEADFAWLYLHELGHNFRLHHANLGSVNTLVERFDIEPFSLIFQPNDQTL